MFGHDKHPKYSDPGPEFRPVLTYKLYYQVIDTFFLPTTNINLMVILGRPGISKSFRAEYHIEKSNEEIVLIKGNTTPPAAYEAIWRASGCPQDNHKPATSTYHKTLVFDDAETFAIKPEGRILLRSLTERKTVKQVDWNKQANWLKEIGCPRQFQTKSRVIVLANKLNWGKSDQKLALDSRGHQYYFNPNSLEVHKMVGEWFWDSEIFDYVGSKLQFLNDWEIRPYGKAYDDKIAYNKQPGMRDWWKFNIDCKTYQGDLAIALELLQSKKFKTKAARVEEFVQRTGNSPRTWYNAVSMIEANGFDPNFKAPKIRLTGKPPKKGD